MKPQIIGLDRLRRAYTEEAMMRRERLAVLFRAGRYCCFDYVEYALLRERLAAPQNCPAEREATGRLSPEKVSLA